MLESVVAGDPGVVAVGDYGSILFSPEGISWTAVDSGTTAYLNDVVWTGEAFFAVGDGGAVVTSAERRELGSAGDGHCARPVEGRVRRRVCSSPWVPKRPC